MKKIVLLMSFIALISFGCSDVEEELDKENTEQLIVKNNSNSLDNGNYFTKQNFTINLDDLKNSGSIQMPQANRAGDECTDTNTNTDYALGIPRIGEKIHFVYSSHNEPDLVFNNGPNVNGETQIFHAVKRGLTTIENAIKEINKTNGQSKKHNLFSVAYTNAPQYEDHTNMQINHGPAWQEFNNYGGWDYSHDGVNSIAWVDFGKNSDDPVIRPSVAGNVYTVWDRNGYILERDIILQNNEFMSWAIKSDLTSNAGGVVDCRPEIDIQAVITHFALQSVGLRPLHDNLALAANDATIFKITGFGFGPFVLSNSPLAWHPHSWQTLTPGDRQGAWEAAPEKGFVMIPDVLPVPDVNQLIIHYDFDDDLSEGIVSDQSGNSLDGTIVGTLNNETGISDMAARFANNSYIDLDGINFPGEKLPLTGYTIGAWVKPDLGAFNASFVNTIMRTENHKGEHVESVFLPFGHGARISSSTSIPFVINHVIPTSVTEDQWLHYAITFDTTSRDYIMYINGIAIFQGVAPVQSFLPTNPVGTTLINNWDKLAQIGASNSSGANPFIGLMDDFVLYNYALTASDIDNLKTNGPGAVNNP